MNFSLIKWYFLALLLPICVHALVIQTNQNIQFSKSGALTGYVVFQKRVHKELLALGKYQVSKNRKNVLFTITHIKKGENYKTLNAQPSAIKETRGKRGLKKGTRLVLGGENNAEIATLLNVNQEAYRASKGGGGFSPANSTTGGSSGSIGVGSAANTGNGSTAKGMQDSMIGTQGMGSNPFPPIAGGNSSVSNSYPLGSGLPLGSGVGLTGNSIMPLPLPEGINNGSGASNANDASGGNATSNNTASSANANQYTTLFCSAPIRHGNQMDINIVDRDGKCVSMQAYRDDNTCTYRYDFEKGKAIKQTQFYFISRENKSFNIGGCVDLQGPEYAFALYQDDSKCKLQTTKDKAYGSGQASFFQTQILFRGADGLIHMAKDCSDFANVQEQLIRYDNDSAAKKVRRIVDQYYIDPVSKKKVFISHGIVSPIELDYQEYACGKWEFDDANLQATRPTQIRAFDTMANAYYNVTGCDYSAVLDKTPKIVQPYTKINTTSSVKDEEVDDLDTSKDSPHNLPEYRTFEIKERVLGSGNRTSYSHCDDGWSSWTKSKDYIAYYNGDLRTIAKWSTEYKTINTGTTQVYIRPRNDGDDEAQYNTYKFYYVSKAKKELQRTPLSIETNTANLDDTYRHNVELVILSNKLNLNTGVLGLINTPEFNAWKQQNYHPGNGNLCLNYSTRSGESWKPSSKAKYCTWGETPDANYSCAQHNDFVLP